MLIAAGVMGWLGGCNYAKQDIKAAETVFVERVKVVKEIEKIEVPKFVTKIQWLKETQTQLIEAAKNEEPNPVSCDLSADRVLRISQSATGNP